jgi:DNA-binding protein H-NS
MTSILSDIDAKIKMHDEQIAQLRKQADEIKAQERASVIEEVRQKIAEYGLTASDLKLASRGGRKGAMAAVRAPVAMKYRNPATGEAWSGGRGRKPRWVIAALAAGQSLSDFEIK